MLRRMLPTQAIDSSAPTLRHAILSAVPLWLVFMLVVELTTGTRVAHNLGDPDDALRLQQVRDLLAGQAWYDLVQHRFDPPSGVFIHWSRLIDLPIAGLILLFRPFVGMETAELWTRMLWPPVPVLLLLAASGYIAGRLGGVRAMAVAMLFAAIACCFISLVLPGRIDHHTVQLALTLVLFAGIFGRSRRAAAVAGLSAALMLAIGMETMPYTVLACAMLVLRWIRHSEAGEFLRVFVRVFCGASFLFFAVTLSPALWRAPACDMISPVYLLPLLAATLILVPASLRLGGGRPAARAAVVAGVGLVAVALVVMLNPACLRGPFGELDPRLLTVWMDDVGEARSGLRVFHDDPETMLATFALPAVAIVAGIQAVMRAADPRGRAMAGPLALVIVSFLVSVWQVRAVSFASMFAIPLLAVLLVRAADAAAARGFRPAFALALFCALVNPLTLPMGGLLVGEAVAASRQPATARDHCTDPAVYRSLAALPAGVVLAPVEIGSFIIATTPHAVVAAPYHRNREGILDAYDFFAGNEGAARRIAARHGVRYVAYCRQSADAAAWATGGADALEARLEHGEAPDWLEPVQLAATERLRIFRVR